MLARRTARLSAAALGQAFQAPGSFLVRVTANRQRDWTLSLRKGHTLQQRLFCVDAALVHLGKRPQPLDPHPIRSSSGFVIAEWGHLNRASTLAENLPRRAQLAGGGHLHVRHPLDGVKRRHISRGQPAGSDSVKTTQIRASSTAAAAKKSEERTTDADKGDEQNAKEAPAAEKTPMEPEPEEGKPNKTQQLKKVFKEYGAVGVSFHIGISLMSLGMFYLLLSSGIDMTALLCRLGFSEAVVQSKMAAGTSTFVLAYAIHKLFAPVRISVTLVSVPLIVRYLRRTGLFKPPTPAP